MPEFDTVDTSSTQPQPPITDRPPRWRALIGGGLIVVLLAVAAVSIGLGSAANSNYHEAQRTIAALRHTIKTQQSTIRTQAGQVSAEKQRADQAVASANAAAKAKYAAKMTAVGSALAQARSERRHYQRLIGAVQASAISAPGVYVVGKDIQAGVWHTGGNGGGSGSFDQCYFAVLNGTDTSNIADNNNFTGPETVTVNPGQSLQLDGSCTWHHV